ncbi:hypothetical protein [Streptomyces sp. NPDC051554]|uniref:hypothetical protein n=1 Tax=Streptomyces sp. NPDC051554 TaxID=3365656 RepID=UPI00378DA9D2
MTNTVITTADPLPPGHMVAIDGEDLLLVVSTKGTAPGPYTSVLQRVPAWRLRLARWRRWLAGPWRRWRDSRCEPSDGRDAWCWRRAVCDGRCFWHALLEIERGEEL